MQEIKWVVYDYGGVISKEQNKHIITRMCQLLDISIKDFTPLYRKERSIYDAGLMDLETYWKHKFTRMNNEIQTINLNKLYDLDIQSWLDINKETTDYISSIKPKVHLALLSNMPTDFVPQIRRQQWYKLFDISIFSCEEKICKPDKKIYNILLNRIQTEPRYVLFIDDVEENVIAARETGINGIRFFDNRSMKTEIEKNYIFQIKKTK